MSKPLNPYDTTGWTGDISIVQSGPIAVNNAGATLILNPSPARLFFVVTHNTPANIFKVWPFPQGSQYGISPPSAQQHVLIHNASYPSLVQMQWYCITDVGIDNVFVIEGIDLRYGERDYVR